MAAGSMGAVYKAERVPVGKLVAIKFLHASFANDSEFQARFERETRVMSKLNHPNCVSRPRFRRVGRRAVPRDGLRRRHRRCARASTRGRIPPIEALAIARQILAASRTRTSRRCFTAT